MRPIVREILGERGPIAAALGGAFEAREEQLAMAEAVNRTLAAKHRMLIEAGTGVGKSFAYLVPAILRCITAGERVVVATHTINLQEQLLRKDIPLLAETIPQWPIDQKAAVALSPVLVKGRGNYVSIRRLQLASQRQQQFFGDMAEQRSLHAIEDWATTTTDGSLSSLPQLERPGVWERVQSDTDNCMGRKCRHYDACFYQNSRRVLEAGNLFVCNHAVFFADLKLRDVNAGFLPEYHHVILDEAHNLEDVASDHFGITLTESRVDRLLGTLYHARTGKGYLAQLSSIVNADSHGMLDKAVAAVHECHAASRAFFEQLLQLEADGKLVHGRLPRAEMLDAPLAGEMKRLSLILKNLRDGVKNEEDRFELQSYSVRAESIAFDADVLVNQKQSGCVYWLEGGGRDEPQRFNSFGRASRPRVRLACSPIDVAPELHEKLFSKEIGVILTSATLATTTSVRSTAGGTGVLPVPVIEVDGARTGGTLVPPMRQTGRETGSTKPVPDGFTHARTRLGCDDAAAMQLGSLFDFSTQAKLIVDLTVPDPRSGGAAILGGIGRGGQRASYNEYLDHLADRVFEHVAATNAGAFVLFTSFASLHGVADRIDDRAAASGYTLLVQGRDGPTSQLLDRFRSADNAVLLGAASFWQGVDVRGQTLRNVIITKLPFDPPDRPLVEARNERIKARGGDPFREESLPRALLRFRQGFGRLIRSKTDFGQVVILDPRVANTGYGRLFMQALPPGLPVETIRPAPRGIPINE